MESPTLDKVGVDVVGNYFIEMAKPFGWDIEVSKLGASKLVLRL